MFSTDDPSILEQGSTPKPKYSRRQQVCLELLETEKNYLSVLDTILDVSKI